jgi:23S rRNA (cytidine1920-2'-O)/16S rRNA (cytidine1409-2'-O)-methyltransferase
MTRLDVWLVENGLFTSRQAAKRAIKKGHITVNGKIAKPSTRIKGTEDIHITKDNLDRPIGYAKLDQLDAKYSLLTSKKHALDIGSSAGGFLIYLLEKGYTVTGIEVSEEFIDQLNRLVADNHNLSIVIGDAFQIDPADITSIGSLDLLLVDVTTDPDGTVDLIEQYSPLLMTGGHLVAAIKSKKDTTLLEHLFDSIESLGYTELHYEVLDESRKEIHVIARRK